MKTRSMIAALVLAAAALVPFAAADETTFCNAYITSLPYTITIQGHYCFNRNLATGITTGDAITVDVDFVVLDLNNFKLGGGSAGPGTTTNGVRVNGRSNVTIRNGNIRGFYRGVFVDATGGLGRNNIVENITADGNTFLGIYVASPNPGALVRGNIVVNTGGTTAFSAYTMGIWTENFDSITQDNIVSGTVATSGGGTIQGIFASGWAIHNIVTGSGTGFCFANNSTTIYRDNNARNCTTAYAGGTNAGGNYP